MSVLYPLRFWIAALTVCFVYLPPLIDISACTVSCPTVKPNWLKEPMPPLTFEPYDLSTCRNSFVFGPLSSCTSVISALTNSLWFQTGPSEVASESVLHGVEHAQMTLSSRFSFCAPCRICWATGGVKLSTTAPCGPAD